MKLRAFLSTVPMAALALALPAQAESRYVAVMDPYPDPEPTCRDYRAWWSTVDWEALRAEFISVERCANGDKSHMRMSTSNIDRAEFAREVRHLEEAHSRWTALGGTPPAFLPRMTRFP